MSDRKNVLFVVIDQLRADCVFGKLAGHVDMPNLRAFMADAVSFQNHFSATSPCGPSRVSMLTGQYAMNHRSVRNGTPIPHDKPNLATEARKAGYLPLLFGYTDSAPDPRTLDPNDPMLRSYEQVLPGFVEALEMRLEESWPWRADLLSKGYDVPAYPDIFRPSGSSPDDPSFYKAEDSDTAFLTNRLIDDLRARPKGWFAHLTYIRPHPPLVAPEPYNKMYDPASLPEANRPRDRAGEEAAHPFNPPGLRYQLARQMVEGFPELQDTPENVAMLRSIYFGLATEVDHHLGRVFDFLKETGQYDNTLVVVTADHGELLGDFHFWGKSTYYDAAYFTPLVIRDPSLKQCFGRVVNAPTESVDVTPTILDMIGRDIPDTMDGRSLRPFLQGETPQNWRDYSFSELDYGNPVDPTVWQEELDLSSDQTNLSILRGKRHTLVHFNGGLPPLLFDHEAEGENKDVSAESENSATLLSMYRILLDHRMTHEEGRFSKTMVTPVGVQRGPH